MYAYIFDSFLQDRKYTHELSQIENRLVTLGIQGRTEKMTILKNLQEGARGAVKRGATTLVVVGNDETITRVLPQLIDKDVTLGFIPIGPQQSIARMLGIPNGISACDMISRRVIRRLDMGKANNAYFLFTLTAPATVQVECGKYTISSLDPTGSFTITNFPVDGTNSVPDDGRLELVVTPGEGQGGWKPFRQRSTSSVFPITAVKIVSAIGSTMVTLDGKVTVKTPVTVEVAKNTLAVIVGKERGF